MQPQLHLICTRFGLFWLNYCLMIIRLLFLFVFSLSISVLVIEYVSCAAFTYDLIWFGFFFFLKKQSASNGPFNICEWFSTLHAFQSFLRLIRFALYKYKIIIKTKAHTNWSRKKKSTLRIQLQEVWNRKKKQKREWVREDWSINKYFWMKWFAKRVLFSSLFYHII